jgi:predicted RNA polymerase sigma factor
VVCRRLACETGLLAVYHRSQPAVDRLRREAKYRQKLALIARTEEQPEDERLKLMFTCCHPALWRESQVALTLRTVCGLTTGEIARAFLTSEGAIAQRLVRARRKIVEARIPYRIPKAEELNGRLTEVLAVIYLMFNEGYLTSGGEHAHRPDLVTEAEWLCRILARLIPTEPEVLGLHALIQLHRARAEARFDAYGGMVLLRDQDRSMWDRAAIQTAANLVLRASEMRRAGPYQIQAAIIACHAESESWADTDWPQILLLYDALLQFMPTPVARLNRAIARRYVEGAKSALREVEALDAALPEYRLYHATRAELLRELGRSEEARDADRLALSLTENAAERALLEERLR